MSLDFTIYPDSYPIFNKQRQYLLRNHAAHLDLSQSRPKHITRTPGIKRMCEIHKSQNDGFISPPNLPELSQSKPNSSMGNYQISYYPNSPLNPELEERCALLEVFKNLKSVNVHKLKIKPVKRIARKNVIKKFDAGFRKMNQILNLIEKTHLCIDCGQSSCDCKIVDKLADEVNQKILLTSENEMKRDRYTSIDNFITPRIAFNKTKMDFIGKRTRRKNRNISIDVGMLRRDIIITPCLIKSKK